VSPSKKVRATELTAKDAETATVVLDDDPKHIEDLYRKK